MSRIVELELDCEDGGYLIFTEETGRGRLWEPVTQMSPDIFAALCVVVKREASRRERSDVGRLKTEEEE